MNILASSIFQKSQTTQSQIPLQLPFILEYVYEYLSTLQTTRLKLLPLNLYSGFHLLYTLSPLSLLHNAHPCLAFSAKDGSSIGKSFFPRLPRRLSLLKLSCYLSIHFLKVLIMGFSFSVYLLNSNIYNVFLWSFAFLTLCTFLG